MHRESLQAFKETYQANRIGMTVETVESFTKNLNKIKK